MKSTPPKSVLTTVLAMLGMGGHRQSSPVMRLHAAPAPPIPTSLLRRILRPISQSPHRNQRKIRKARRQRWAAGDRKAFR